MVIRMSLKILIKTGEDIVSNYAQAPFIMYSLNTYYIITKLILLYIFV